MGGFKLLAIRPLEKCHVDFSKNLINGEIYQFYNEFEFIKEYPTSNSYIKKIIYRKEISEDFFSENGLNINISAVVGKNGSGKSSLLELLFLLKYLVSVDENLIDIPEDKIGLLKYQELTKKLSVEVYYKIDEKIYCISYENKLLKFNEFLIENNENINETNENKVNYLKQKIDKFDFSSFFYSVAVNYSIYGLNSKIIGTWIEELFHKNDAYQIPLVINPMRTKGNFDINEENYLLKSRLISNILSLNKEDKLLYDNIASNKKVIEIEFSLNRKKIDSLREVSDKIVWTFDALFENYDSNNNSKNGKNNILNLIYNELVGLKRENCKVRFRDEVEFYIIKKLHKISLTYLDFKIFTDSFDQPLNLIMGQNPNLFPYFMESGENSFANYLTEIKKEKSHITFKLNQAINYLKYNTLEEISNSLWTRNESINFSVIDLAKRIKKIDSNNSELINLIPPSLFNIKILIEDSNQKDIFSLESMSSGEQQLIHSIQSIVYHIRNINSVFKKNSNLKNLNTGKKRMTYDSINIILDEVELYYHPEYQREFINNLFFSIRQIKFDKKEGVRNLNILFSTHSPFILSDIPSQNILKLKRDENGLSKPMQIELNTFGANIHDLLANEFFLTKGFMGEFAKEKINETINYLNFHINLSQIKLIEELKVENRKKFHDLKLKALIAENDYIISLMKSSHSGDEKEKHLNVISLIGEKLLQNKLEDMYNQAFN